MTLLSDADLRQREWNRLEAEKEKPVKYAVYVVLVEDTNESIEALSETGVIDSIDSVVMDAEYDDAKAVYEAARTVDK